MTEVWIPVPLASCTNIYLYLNTRLERSTSIGATFTIV